MGWVYQKGKLENSYCLYDRNYLLLANGSAISYNQNPILSIFKEHEAEIISSNFSISNTHFVSLDANNTVIEHSFSDESYSKKRQAHEKLKALSIAISPNDESEMVGFENGFIQVHSILRKSKKDFDLYFKAHKKGVYSIKFNSLGSYFISSGLDDSVKVWDSKDLKMLAQFSAFTKSGFSPLFSPLKDDFVYLSDEKMLVVSNIQGDLSHTIFVSEGIKMAGFTEQEDKIAILTLDGRLLFYSISTGKMLGELYSGSASPINSFSVNIVSGDIVLGTNEGEVYLCNKGDISSVSLSKKNKIEKAKGKERNTSSLSSEDAFISSIKDDGNVDKQSFPKPSDREIDYWGLEDAPTVVDSAMGKPSFSIKDETPLEEPMQVLGKEEAKAKEKKEKAKSPKSLNATVFDDDNDIDFPKENDRDKEKNKGKSVDILPLKNEDEESEEDEEGAMQENNTEKSEEKEVSNDAEGKKEDGEE